MALCVAKLASEISDNKRDVPLGGNNENNKIKIKAQICNALQYVCTVIDVHVHRAWMRLGSQDTGQIDGRTMSCSGNIWRGWSQDSL